MDADKIHNHRRYDTADYTYVISIVYIKTYGLSFAM